MINFVNVQRAHEKKMSFLFSGYKVCFQVIEYICIKSSILRMLFRYSLSFLFIVCILLNSCHRLREVN